MDRETIRTEIRNLISDTDTVNPKWSDTLLNNRINQAQLDIVSRTNCLKTYSTASIVASTGGYDLPTDALKILRVSYKDANGYIVRLKETTAEELDLLNGKWQDDTSSDPSNYLIFRNQILLYPIPTVSRADALTYDYTEKPDDMDEDTDIPFNTLTNLYPFHYLICDYVTYLCKSDEKDIPGTQSRLQIYLSKINDMKDRIEERLEDRRILNIYETTRKSSRNSVSFSTNPFVK